MDRACKHGYTECKLCHACAFCGAKMSWTPPPKSWDGAAWLALAVDHDQTCAWIKNRAWHWTAPLSSY